MPSALSVYLSARCLFPISIFWTAWPLTLIVCKCTAYGHDYSSPRIESQGHRSRSKVKTWSMRFRVKLVLHVGLSTYAICSRWVMKESEGEECDGMWRTGVRRCMPGCRMSMQRAQTLQQFNASKLMAHRRRCCCCRQLFSSSLLTCVL